MAGLGAGLRTYYKLDNPDKYQYPVSDVTALGGADFQEVANSSKDRYASIKDMIAWCIDNDITEVCDLIIYASEERDDWFAYLCDNSLYIIKEFLKSMMYKKGNKR